MEDTGQKNRRISVDLPDELIARFDKLKKEWGQRSRGAVLKRLLEEILIDEDTDSTGNELINQKEIPLIDKEYSESTGKKDDDYDEVTALVLIGNKSEIMDNIQKTNSKDVSNYSPNKTKENTVGIDLPGFVHKKSAKLRKSLNSTYKSVINDVDPLAPIVNEYDLKHSEEEASKHWLSLYGQPPGETVIEAAMLWLARDIWHQIDESQAVSFTWRAANHSMRKYCKSWDDIQPTFERIMVVAGVLEDPFASKSLPQRMPTLIRRFVNKFRRSSNVTSFETIESTMTVHGALRILGLPTTAGSALTLNRIREYYKIKAMDDHPDSGGSTEAMRRLNEAYQLLKELYRKKG